MSANSSLFAQLLQLLPQATFRKIVREEHGERCAKGFTCRMQLVAMLYRQLAQAKSLAEICDGQVAFPHRQGAHRRLDDLMMIQIPSFCKKM